MTNKIGVLGGTFDPVHVAHLDMARKGMEVFNLKKIYFLLTINPPHKEQKTNATIFDRYTMLVLATIDNDNLLPYILEHSPSEGEYTIYMLDAFCKEQSLKRDEILFLAGGDSFRDIYTWRNHKSLLDHYRFLFFDRKGVSYHSSSKDLIQSGTVKDYRDLDITKLRLLYRSDNSSMLVDLDIPDISSTSIRTMLKSNKNCSMMLHPYVAQYIKKIGLYGVK